MPEQPINEQTRQMMGMPTSGDPAIIDPTTGRPYTPDASMRQQEEITRQAEVKEEFVSEQRLQLPKDLEEEIEGQIRPKARPEGLPNVYEKNTAIDKTLEYGYLLKERQPGAKGKTRIVTGLDERDPAQQRIIKSFFDTAVGGDTGFDPTKQAWCAAFVNHILTEMGADLIESKDPYKRLRANEYKTYGKPVDLENIQEGDIVVFDFDKDGTADHVTFYAGGRITSQGEGQYINVIGGNQGGGEVSIRENEPGYTLDNVAAIRRVTYDGDAYEIAQSHKDSDPIFKTFLPEEHEDYAQAQVRRLGSYNEGGDVSAQTDNLFGYTDEAVTKEVDKYKEDVNTELSFKDAATFVAEATPIIGDALAAKEVYDELQKDDPNYLLVGALGGAALVGLIPGLGDAAASAIKTGAKKTLDTAKRIEVDPNALGSMGGNINLKTGSTKEPKKKIRYRDDIDPEVYDAFEELADIQRGKPELAMVEAQNILSGGVLPYALEHTGDLTHRMAEKGGVYGSEYVAPKVDRLLNSLFSEYGFEKEMSENIASNARFKYENEKPNISFEQYEKEYQEAVNQALKKYAEEHKKVPVYNEMQLAGREAAVALGEGRYTDATENLYKIKMALNDKNYAEKSMQFNPEIDFRNKPKDFNKGGAVMNEQMEMAFMQQGGLKDDGMKRDPVSGNEVPNGSMAKEVRDDISAQLSEGEYVVPADVVRYLGVKHFEDLRDKAKQGLQSMEANGRIGGEPVPVGGPQAAPMMQPPMPQAPTPYSPQPAPMAPPQMAMGGDLSPEEMNEINNIMMAQGGMVPADPYQQQQMQYTQPMAQGLDVGGPVVQPPAVPEIPQVSPYSSFTPSGNFSWENSVSITDTEVPVENEASCEARGLVYNLDTKMCEEPETPVIETPVVGGDDSSPSSDQAPTATPWYENTNWSTEGVQSSIDKYFGKESKFGSGISSVIGGVLGGIPGAAVGRYGAQVANLSTARAEIEIRKAMGDTAGAEALQKAVDDQLKASAGLGKADEIVNAFFGSDGDMKVIEDLKAAGINVDSALRDDKLDAFLSNLSLSDKTRLQKFHNFTPGKPVKAVPTEDKKSVAGMPSGRMGFDPKGGGLEEAKRIKEQREQDSSDDGPSAAQIAAARAQTPTAKASTGTKTTEEARSSAASAAEKLGTGLATGGRATGGLVSRPKKKK